MELNQESVLDALNDFERKPIEIPPILEDYLLRIAKNGEIVFPWGKLKPLLKRKLELVLDEFYESCPVEISTPVPNFENFNFENLKKTILQSVEGFTSAPFTIQRLCELVTNPKKHYNRTDKYMRGVEKNVLVVSTVEPRLSAQGEGLIINLNPVVNGMINDSPREDNDCFNGHENDDDSSKNVNSSSNHVLLENFANVFPSAACIPSASNICINREIEESYRVRRCSDLVAEEDDIDLPSLSASEEADNIGDVELKEEEMDTTEEISDSFPAVDVELSTEESKGFEESNPANGNAEEIAPSDDNPKIEDESDVENCVNASEDVQCEADCSGSSECASEPEQIDLNQCNQDDTISQSDDSTNSLDISQSSALSETVETSVEEETVIEAITAEVEQSSVPAVTEASDSSEQIEESSPIIENVDDQIMHKDF